MSTLNSIEIARQKEIADIILEKLEIIDPSCILAGGAPRDWYMGVPANDLDFYLHLNRHNTLDSNTKSLEGVLGFLGISDLKNISAKEMTDSNGDYAKMSHLRTVYETTYRSVKVQFMVMYEPTSDSVVDHFGCSLSKAWYKPSRGLVTTEEFLYSLKTGVIYHNVDITFKEKYYKKMKSRFSQYTFKPASKYEEDFKETAVRGFKRELAVLSKPYNWEV